MRQEPDDVVVVVVDGQPRDGDAFRRQQLRPLGGKRALPESGGAVDHRQLSCPVRLAERRSAARDRQAPSSRPVVGTGWPGPAGVSVRAGYDVDGVPGDRVGLYRIVGAGMGTGMSSTGKPCSRCTSRSCSSESLRGRRPVRDVARHRLLDHRAYVGRQTGIPQVRHRVPGNPEKLGDHLLALATLEDRVSRAGAEQRRCQAVDIRGHVRRLAEQHLWGGVRRANP